MGLPLPPNGTRWRCSGAAEEVRRYCGPSGRKNHPDEQPVVVRQFLAGRHVGRRSWVQACTAANVTVSSAAGIERSTSSSQSQRSYFDAGVPSAAVSRGTPRWVRRFLSGRRFSF